MNKRFNKIIIISLNDQLTQKIGKTLAEKLEMMFCDAKDLMEYDLIDKGAIEQFCTKEYLEESEKKVFKHIASFMNVVVSINFDSLINNIDVLEENALIVFLKVAKTHISDPINKVAFKERNKTLEDISDVTVSVRKLDANFVYDKIIKALGGIL